MENITEIWYRSIDWSMVWVCLGTSILFVVSLYISYEKNIFESKQNNGIANYMRPTWKNSLFHVGAGLILLAIIDEKVWPLIINLTSLPFEYQSDSKHFMAFVCGLSGGIVVAKIIKLVQKLN